MSARELAETQYKDGANLNARIQLHVLYSENRYGWHRWLFDQFDVPDDGHVLEIGCGTGQMWVENQARVAGGWDVTLADFSPGMVREARQNLAGVGPRFRWLVADAQAIPLADDVCDAVIANHMLYHVPDRERALAEIRRVLRPAGRLYASTVGERNMQELGDFVNRFQPGMAYEKTSLPFTLENGGAQLARHFRAVSVREYADALAVTEAAPLVAYILSGRAQQTLGPRAAELTHFIEAELAHRGVIHISKSQGLFIAER